MSHIRTRLRNQILWLILDRPPLNLLSVEMLDHLTAALHQAIKQSPHLIVLMGAGEDAFSAGIDAQDQLNGQETDLLRAVVDICTAFEGIRARGIPTAALVKGTALGSGCELAVLCDTVLAHENATFGLPEISMGILPPIASTYFPKILGYQTAMRLLLTGEIIDAHEALRLKLAHQVLSAHRFLQDAEELLAALASPH